jgi:Malate:quinone oxidoreductase (Mqo)
VFVGAGGDALPLLQKSKIPEGKGYGGFPVSGIWLRCDVDAVSQRHHAKVYGKAASGSPPMSVPHLDTRIIGGAVPYGHSAIVIVAPLAGRGAAGEKIHRRQSRARGRCSLGSFPALGELPGNPFGARVCQGFFDALAIRAYLSRRPTKSGSV